MLTAPKETLAEADCLPTQAECDRALLQSVRHRNVLMPDPLTTLVLEAIDGKRGRYETETILAGARARRNRLIRTPDQMHFPLFTALVGLAERLLDPTATPPTPTLSAPHERNSR
jgi:hypothetical protein